MSILYVGDIHGNYNAYHNVEQYCIKNGITDVVQVGDFGLSFAMGKNDPMRKYFAKKAEQGLGPDWWVCDGNHDNTPLWKKWADEQSNPDVVELVPGVKWVRRGVTIELDSKKHLFMGGAESTDKHHRTEGISWWPDETPTYEEFRRFAAALEDEKPEVVVSHDAPLCVDVRRYGRNTQPTPRNLENAFKMSGHKPAVWVFGHHHTQKVWDVDDTTFVCCGLNGQHWNMETGFGGKTFR